MSQFLVGGSWKTVSDEAKSTISISLLSRIFWLINLVFILSGAELMVEGYYKSFSIVRTTRRFKGKFEKIATMEYLPYQTFLLKSFAFPFVFTWNGLFFVFLYTTFANSCIRVPFTLNNYWSLISRYLLVHVLSTGPPKSFNYFIPVYKSCLINWKKILLENKGKFFNLFIINYTS